MQGGAGNVEHDFSGYVLSDGVNYFLVSLVVKAKLVFFIRSSNLSSNVKVTFEIVTDDSSKEMAGWLFLA